MTNYGRTLVACSGTTQSRTRTPAQQGEEAASPRFGLGARASTAQAWAAGDVPAHPAPAECALPSKGASYQDGATG